MTARRLPADDSGATAIEYALLAGFIATVIIVAVASLGTTLDTLYGDANTKLTTEIEAAATEQPK